MKEGKRRMGIICVAIVEVARLERPDAGAATARPGKDPCLPAFPAEQNANRPSLPPDTALVLLTVEGQVALAGEARECQTGRRRGSRTLASETRIGCVLVSLL